MGLVLELQSVQGHNLKYNLRHVHGSLSCLQPLKISAALVVLVTLVDRFESVQSRGNEIYTYVISTLERFSGYICRS